MSVEYSEKTKQHLPRLQDFMDAYIHPNDKAYWDWLASACDRWQASSLSLFRTAANLIGVHRRAVEDDASSAQAVGAETYLPIAEIAARLVQPEAV